LAETVQPVREKNLHASFEREESAACFFLERMKEREKILVRESDSFRRKLRERVSLPRDLWTESK
jgi:hypothetical protein